MFPGLALGHLLVKLGALLATAGIFDNWVKTCPLHYTSPNASSVRDVLGTLMLGVLSGSKRYAHLAGIRSDQVAAQALGLNKIVSEASARRALSAMAPGESAGKPSSVNCAHWVPVWMWRPKWQATSDGGGKTAPC
ncbi:MAG: hypothetical protein WBI05_04005 [Rhodoferax sp.]